MDPKTHTFLEKLLNDEVKTIDQPVYDFLRAHTIHFLPDIKGETKELDEKIRNDRLFQLKKYYVYLNNIATLNKLLDKPIILKGLAAAQYYPSPDKRAIGDVDFIFIKSSEEKLKHYIKILKDNGYQLDEDTLKARHISFNKDRFHYEMHRYFSRRLTDEDYRIDTLIEKSAIQKNELNGFSFYCLEDEVNGLILLSHIEHHIHSGLGLRQLIDFYYFYRKSLNTSENYERFMKLAEDYGFRKLAITILDLCINNLGGQDAAYREKADTELREQLFDYICQSGNFGRSTSIDTRKTLGAIASGLSYSDLKRKGLINMERYNSRLPKELAAFYQLFRYLRLGLSRKALVNNTYSDLKKYNSLNRLLKGLGIKNET